MVVVVDYNVGFSINFPLKLLFDACENVGRKEV
jgi:hypothetical protein